MADNFDTFNAGPSPWPEPWKRCPSTHCERAEECRSPHDCTVRKPPKSDAGHIRRVQALGAAISRREWGEVESAYAAIRDAKS